MAAWVFVLAAKAHVSTQPCLTDAQVDAGCRFL
jgi:hypothetical protein